MIRRKRWLYAILALLTIPMALSTRMYAAQLPKLVALYGGDALYATFLFFLVRLAWAHWRLAKVAVVTGLLCLLIELFQLYQAPWINTIRHTPPFGLILGFGFLWSDLVCYLAGACLGWLIAWPTEKAMTIRTHR